MLFQHVSNAIALLTVSSPLNLAQDAGRKRQESLPLQVKNVEVQAKVEEVRGGYGDRRKSRESGEAILGTIRESLSDSDHGSNLYEPDASY